LPLVSGMRGHPPTLGLWMKVFDHSLTSAVVLKLIQGHETALILFDLILLLNGRGEHLPLGFSASLIITDYLLLVCAAT
jgi:hypothetical protein